MALGRALAYPAYRVSEAVVSTLPRPWAMRLVRAGSLVAMVVLRRRRRLVEGHLRRVCGGDLEGAGLRRAVAASFRSYGEYWLDTFRLGRTDPERLEERMRADGLERLDAAVAAGHGAVLATAHFGSWDLAGAWLGRRGYPLLAVAERLPSERLVTWFTTLRERFGMEIVVRDDDVWGELAAAMDRGSLVILVADRDLSGKGPEVTFFGEPTTLPAGPGRLARTYDAPLLPVAVYDLGDGRHRGVVGPPVEVPRTDDPEADVDLATQRLAHALEDLIRVAPTQWHLMSPNWPADRETA